LQPLSYVRDKLIKAHKKRERNYYLANIFGLITFLLVTFFLAPLIHDLFHLIVLKIFNCEYTFYFSYNWDRKFHGEIQTFCDLSTGKAIIMLGAGIFGTSFISLILFFFSWFYAKLGKLPLSNFLIYPALGFFTDIFFYFFMIKEGDILGILKTINRTDLIPIVPYIGLFLFTILILYLYIYMKEILRDYSLIKEKIKEIDDFIISSSKEMEKERI